MQRADLDLDAAVISYWPEFVGGGKQTATVRQLLSHQVGLPDAEPIRTSDEVLGHHDAAARLAATVPFWRPGSAFGYHGLSIGNLADELVWRATGRTLHEVYESDVRRPCGAEVFLGLPEQYDHRSVPVLPMVARELGLTLSA